ncbi:MAG: hypothetical protein KatS3mg028_0147 [Bacteroidia bacterium]|nr:MAG: hypothetical protein KatS3mg028_0147 [Bacteroidia bacterium]
MTLSSVRINRLKDTVFKWYGLFSTVIGVLILSVFFIYYIERRLGQIKLAIFYFFAFQKAFICGHFGAIFGDFMDNDFDYADCRSYRRDGGHLFGGIWTKKQICFFY